MKKIACLMAVLMMVGAVPGFCGMSATVDGFIEDRMNSDLRPIEDTGRILDVTNRGIDRGYRVVTDPMHPVLDPVRRVRDESVKGVKTVTNTTWDILTLRRFRDKG
ncbi:MAG: hypothetical protein A2Z83_08320 [Omnitrophica bacterium GWA2_52_8]|nr:MAG: hypothetical protein A2Z83_08320 [Omnitrophica bacterium GWA2_52_8]